MPSGQINAKTIDGVVSLDVDTLTADKIDAEKLYLNGKRFYDSGDWLPIFHFMDAKNGNNRNYLAYYEPRVGYFSMVGDEVMIEFSVSGEVRTEDAFIDNPMHAYIEGLPYQCHDDFAYGGMLDPAGNADHGVHADDGIHYSHTGGCWFSVFWVPIIGSVSFSADILPEGVVSSKPDSAPHVHTGYDIKIITDLSITIPVPKIKIKYVLNISNGLNSAYYGWAAGASIYFKCNGTLRYRTNGIKNPNLNQPGPWDPVPGGLPVDPFPDQLPVLPEEPTGGTLPAIPEIGTLPTLPEEPVGGTLPAIPEGGTLPTLPEPETEPELKLDFYDRDLDPDYEPEPDCDDSEME